MPNLGFVFQIIKIILMKIYHNPRCSKSREALSILQDNGVKPEVILYLKNPLKKKEINDLLKKLNISAFDLIRKSESIYKEKYKDRTMSEDQWLDAMVKHPKLIERPIVEKASKATIGRPPSLVLKLL